MEGERDLGGLRCGEVLAALEAFVGGTLEPEAREALGTHVAGCSHCDRFGGTYAAVVQRIRAMRRSEAPDQGVLDRLSARLSNLLPT